MNRELPRYLKKRLMRCVLCPMKLLPVKKHRVLLHNDLSYKYAGNPRYIADKLMKEYPEQFEIIFSVADTERYIHRGMPVHFVRFNSLKYFYYAMTSNVLVTNSGGLSYIPLRKKQFVLNTNHGGGCYKSNGLDMFEDTPLFRKDLKMAADQTDIFMSTCRRFSEVDSKATLLPIERYWEVGMPRNDILFEKNPDLIGAVKEKLGLKPGEKLVLYAPTYRKPEDNYFQDSVAISYGIDCQRVCEALQKRFSGEWKFGFRLHPCVTNRDELPKGNIIDLSDYEEMQELLLAADAMINDFSSSMWDYMLTGKPCFTYATDLDHYVRTTKVYTPVKDWPFPKAVSNDELVRNILEFDEEQYKEDCKKHYVLLGGCETGKATKLASELIYKKCFEADR